MKDSITLNNIRVIMLFFILPFAAIIYSLLDPKWFLVGALNGHYYYVNLLDIYITTIKDGTLLVN